MAKIACFMITVVLLTALVGCKKTGYEILIATDSMVYHDIQVIETMLKDIGFRVAAYTSEKGEPALWRERPVAASRQPGEVYTFLYKELSKERYSWIEVYVNYVKMPNDIVKHVLIRVKNTYIGLSPEMKDRIDNVGDQIYGNLSTVVGPEHVRVERKEVSPPTFY